MEEGKVTSWDYQPQRDASNEYVRNHMDWTVAAERTRFRLFGKTEINKGEAMNDMMKNRGDASRCSKVGVMIPENHFPCIKTPISMNNG